MNVVCVLGGICMWLYVHVAVCGCACWPSFLFGVGFCCVRGLVGCTDGEHLQVIALSNILLCILLFGLVVFFSTHREDIPYQ